MEAERLDNALKENPEFYVIAYERTILPGEPTWSSSGAMTYPAYWERMLTDPENYAFHPIN